MSLRRRLSAAASGEPWDRPSRALSLSRAITQMLGYDSWSSATLNRVAVRLLNGDAPAAANGAVDAVREAFLAVEPQPRRLKQQLLGALSVPGWFEATLEPIGRVLSDRAHELNEIHGDGFAAPLVALRAALKAPQS